MDVVAQQVWTTWTTRSRGGAAAARRNRVPTVFPLPDHAGGQVHRVNVDESTGFASRFALRPIGELATCLCGSEWSYRLETLSLAYGGVPDFTGTPTRTVTELGDLR
ncbi:hypothetical protein OHS18_36665 [Amycolatopsis sp. NBC_00355]|uniref:hypothetical protein n=1 Tax=Amycolatopsis sp. NBC_00355 TaxID=2975957 RepID=UPI002E25CB1E